MNYRKLIDIYKSNCDDMYAVANKLIAFIAINKLDSADEWISTLLDLCVRYTDSNQNPENRDRVKRAIVALLEVIEDDL